MNSLISVADQDEKDVEFQNEIPQAIKMEAVHQALELRNWTSTATQFNQRYPQYAFNRRKISEWATKAKLVMKGSRSSIPDKIKRDFVVRGRQSRDWAEVQKYFQHEYKEYTFNLGSMKAWGYANDLLGPGAKQRRQKCKRKAPLITSQASSSNRAFRTILKKRQEPVEPVLSNKVSKYEEQSTLEVPENIKMEAVQLGLASQNWTHAAAELKQRYPQYARIPQTLAVWAEKAKLYRPDSKKKITKRLQDKYKRKRAFGTILQKNKAPIKPVLPKRRRMKAAVVQRDTMPYYVKLAAVDYCRKYSLSETIAMFTKEYPDKAAFLTEESIKQWEQDLAQALDEFVKPSDKPLYIHFESIACVLLLEQRSDDSSINRFNALLTEKYPHHRFALSSIISQLEHTKTNRALFLSLKERAGLAPPTSSTPTEIKLEYLARGKESKGSWEEVNDFMENKYLEYTFNKGSMITWGYRNGALPNYKKDCNTTDLPENNKSHQIKEEPIEGEGEAEIRGVPFLIKLECVLALENIVDHKTVLHDFQEKYPQYDFKLHQIVTWNRYYSARLEKHKLERIKPGFVENVLPVQRNTIDDARIVQIASITERFKQPAGSRVLVQNVPIYDRLKYLIYALDHFGFKRSLEYFQSTNELVAGTCGRKRLAGWYLEYADLLDKYYYGAQFQPEELPSVVITPTLEVQDELDIEKLVETRSGTEAVDVPFLIKLEWLVARENGCTFSNFKEQYPAYTFNHQKLGKCNFYLHRLKKHKLERAKVGFLENVLSVQSTTIDDAGLARLASIAEKAQQPGDEQSCIPVKERLKYVIYAMDHSGFRGAWEHFRGDWERFRGTRKIVPGTSYTYKCLRTWYFEYADLLDEYYYGKAEIC